MSWISLGYSARPSLPFSIFGVKPRPEPESVTEAEAAGPLSEYVDHFGSSFDGCSETLSDSTNHVSATAAPFNTVDGFPDDQTCKDKRPVEQPYMEQPFGEQFSREHLEQLPGEMLKDADTKRMQQALIQAGVRGLIDINADYLTNINNLEAQIMHSSKILELAKLGNYRLPLLMQGAHAPESYWQKLAQDNLTRLLSKYQRPLLPGDPPMVEHTEFPCFIDLIKDIRYLIWAYALPGPRRHHFNANCKYMNPVPALLHVNRESRQFALQVFTLYDNTYIDLERDQVFCTSYKWDSFLEARNICVVGEDLMASTSSTFLLAKFKFLKSITWFSNVTFASTILTPARPYLQLNIDPIHNSWISQYDCNLLEKLYFDFNYAFYNAGLNKTPSVFATGLSGEGWAVSLSRESDYNDAEKVFQSCRPNTKVQSSPLKQLEPLVSLNAMCLSDLQKKLHSRARRN